jgi:hypothetical protein
MRKFDVRAEFRRDERAAAWVLAGVWVADVFHPAEPGVDPIRRRLPGPGLIGWVELDPVLASSAEHAAEIGLDVAAGRWPKARRSRVPYP